MGKFSQPRNQFQNPTPPKPAAPKPPQEPVVSNAPQQPNVPPEKPSRLQEDSAIEQAFLEVTGGNDDPNPILAFLSRHKFPILIGVCSGLLAILLIVVGVFAFRGKTDPYDGKILDNVSIAGINVGGLTKSQAEEVIRSATEHTFTQQEMVVQIADDYFRLSPSDTKAELNVKAVVKAAYEYGRSGSQAQKEAAIKNAQSDGHIIALLPYLELDTDYIRQAIADYAAGFTSTYTSPEWKLEGEMPDLTVPEEGAPEPVCQTLVITMGTPGIGINVEKLYADVLDAYSFNHFLVQYAEPDPDMLPAAPDLQAIYDECYIAPVDASMDQNTYEPIPGSYGYEFDLQLAQELVDTAGFGETVSVPMQLIVPGIEEESLLFQDILGYCETAHNQNENRNHNLRLVCQTLDGMILDPGEEFSYNGSVGERTAARGFKAAPAYSGTDLVDSVGGGVCQGSSTLYYCALMADMEIIFRVNHGFSVSYIPMGLDATVNWGGPDMQFRNSSNYPIQIKAEVSDGYMKMWIMGTEERDYYIELDYEIAQYIEPDEVIEEHGPESGYTDGQVLQGGTAGYIVRSYKYRYNKATGELISKDFVALSSYMTRDRIIVKIVGGEEEAEPTEPSESTDPSTESTAPPSSETTAPPSSETTAPPSSETTAPPSPETTAPPSAEAASPPDPESQT